MSTLTLRGPRLPNRGRWLAALGVGALVLFTACEDDGAPTFTGLDTPWGDDPLPDGAMMVVDSARLEELRNSGQLVNINCDELAAPVDSPTATRQRAQSGSRPPRPCRMRRTRTGSCLAARTPEIRRTRPIRTGLGWSSHLCLGCSLTASTS